MEDLFPLLIFVVIAIINFLKYLSEKDGKKKPPATMPEEQSEDREPSSIEEFFDEIFEKLEPKPRELPDWPESRERPDYVKEMEEFKQSQKAKPFEQEEYTAEIIPMPQVATPKPRPKEKPVIPTPPIAPLRKVETPPIQAQGRSAMVKLPVQGAVFSGLSGIRNVSPPLLRSATGRIDFDLQDREKLKQSIIANIVFSPPRAYETTFHNTLAE